MADNSDCTNKSTNNKIFVTYSNQKGKVKQRYRVHIEALHRRNFPSFSQSQKQSFPLFGSQCSLFPKGISKPNYHLL